MYDNCLVYINKTTLLQMVRVICVHHFTRQDVASLNDAGEECHGCCPGPGNWLLVGGQHRVNIRDLGQDGAPAGGFPTVDMVQQLVYCETCETWCSSVSSVYCETRCNSMSTVKHGAINCLLYLSYNSSFSNVR